MARQSREGEVLAGKYRLESLLGRGAMGEVYRAHNLLIGRNVAIKLLRPELASDEVIAERFLREARASNIVRHPNVVDVMDICQDDDGAPFIVEELLDGEDLSQYVERKGGKLTPDVSLRIMIPVAQAVGYAHSKGVVHRDLKPANVFLARVNGVPTPKLLDFGLSRITSSPGDVRMTASGMTMGSPAYMSLEQIQGAREVDARTDVWALGVILFEIIAGHLPFDGESHVAVFMQIASTDAPRLDQAVPGIAPDLARVVARCLRKEAKDRYATASEVARDLELVRRGADIEATLKPSVAPPAMVDLGKQGIGLASTMPSNFVDRNNVAQMDQVESSPISSKPSRRAVVSAHGSTPTSPSIQLNSPSGISLGVVRPKPKSVVPSSAAAPETEPRLVWEALTLGVVVLATVGVLTILMHKLGAFSIGSWLIGAVGTSAVLAIIVAAAAVVGAGFFGAHALRSIPKRWGYLVSAVGAGMVAVSIALRLIGMEASPYVLPLGFCLTVLGFGIDAMNSAWNCTKNGSSELRGQAVFFASLAALAWFLAGEMVRAIGLR